MHSRHSAIALTAFRQQRTLPNASRVNAWAAAFLPFLPRRPRWTEQNIERFGRIANLDDFAVVDTMTVLFRNGRSTISSDFRARLRELAQRPEPSTAIRSKSKGTHRIVRVLQNHGITGN